MATFKRLEVLNAIVACGLVPVFYHSDVEVAKHVASACRAGGSRVLEFTNRGDFAPLIFKELSVYCRNAVPGMILGVGSIVDEATAALYIAYGANFVVGPSVTESVARLCNRRKIPYVPGCGSVTEIGHAEQLGVEIVKVFPGDSVGGPGFVKAILGPCPWTMIMPTGGVQATQENITEWFKAGVTAVGMGSNLIRRELLEKSDWEGISQSVATVLGYIREARGLNVFQGIEHFAFSAPAGKSAVDVAGWYQDVFGLNIREGKSSVFVGNSGSGRLEIPKAGQPGFCHVAIRVLDFEAAMSDLARDGIELEEPALSANAKSVYLKGTDPAGNRVHLLWEPS